SFEGTRQTEDPMKTVDDLRTFLLRPRHGGLSSLECEELLQTLRQLSPAQARVLAREVVQLWASDPNTYADAEQVWLDLSCLFPGSLTALHLTLLDGGMFAPNELFRDADSVTRDRLIRTLEQELYDTLGLRWLAF